MEKEIFDIIIVGGGPAGLTALLYSLRANRKVMLLEKMFLGGQILNSYEIANFPAVGTISGTELVSKMQSQVENMGANIKYEEVLEIKKENNLFTVKTSSNTYYSKLIILALGNKDKKLSVEGEKEFTGKGVSYCAVCDGMFFRNKNVAVVGGGNSAVEYCRYLSKIVNKIYLINKNEKLKAEKSQINDITRMEQMNKLEYITNSNVIKICGKEVVDHIVLENNITNQERSIDVDGVFVAIGRESANKFFLDEMLFDEKGYIIADDDMKTNVDGVLACGDIRMKKTRQVITACGDGATASTTAIRLLDEMGD